MVVDWPIRLLRLATAYKAKLLCSGIFVSQREPESILQEDLGVDDLAPLRYVNAKIDFDQQSVTASCLGIRCTALYRPGLGSSLVMDTCSRTLRQQSQVFEQWDSATPRVDHDVPTLKGFAGEAQLNAVLANAFKEENRKRLKRTRAIVVLHKGHIIAERYAPGFSAQTPMLGWSMTKSVVNALIGILVHQGKLSLDQCELLPEWCSPGDERCSITLDQLLRMCDGLSFSEKYNDPRADATTMLFQREDMAAYAARRPLKHQPDSAFHYSSGSSVLLCRVLKQAIGGGLEDYFMFPRKVLFDPLGMASAVLEPDAAGTFTGSSYLYATARDWAKFGLLYLQDGC
ncbi:MAG: serine hydrolase, partial [Cyanobacteria bacterium J06632_22]